MAVTLPRRTFLRGIGGIAVGVPALEIMMPSGKAGAADETTPPRFMTSYVGTSTGRNHYPDDICCGELVGSDRITPSLEGANYDIPQGLQPIGPDAWRYINDFGGDQPAYDIQDDLTVVTGLKVPWGPIGSVPPGGRFEGFHGTSVTPQLAGCVCADRGYPALNPTADQLVAEAIGQETVFAALASRVEVMNYYSGSSGGNMGAMSWKRDEAGNIVRVDPVVNPQLAWETLFTGFTPPDPEEAAQVAFELQKRRTVLDLVRGNTERLVGKLGHADKIRMEQHLDEIRSLETRLQELNVPTSPQCSMPPDPGNIPVGGAAEDVETQTNKWSNEELRAEVLTDLIHMAFVCDLSRVASLMFEHWKSYINMYPAIGQLQDLHDITHFGGSGTGIAPLGDTLAWHVKHFARLASKLRDTPDVDGIPILDRTVMTMVFEGGSGEDPESGGDYSPHSTVNMAVLVAGGRELGLNPGRHIRATDQHPASVLLAGAQACGVTESLGDIAEGLVGL